MSLLTQFYPGPGSGGDGFTNAGGTSPSVAFIGAEVVFPTPFVAGWSTAGWPLVVPNSTTYSNVYAATYSTYTGSGFTNCILSNGYFNINPSVDLKVSKYTLNGCHFNFQFSSIIQHTQTTSIEGSGLLTLTSPTNQLPNLVSISTSVAISGSQNFRCTGSKLDAATVNHVLESIATAIGTNATTITVDMSGGTSAGSGALTAAGLTARNAIVAAGGSVTLN
jgi:hypothetical protein